MVALSFSSRIVALDFDLRFPLMRALHKSPAATVLIGLAWLSAGCAVSADYTSAPDTRPSETDRLLDYARRLTEASLADVEHEYQQLLLTAPDEWRYDDLIRQALMILLVPRRSTVLSDAESLLRRALEESETPADVRVLVDLLLASMSAFPAPAEVPAPTADAALDQQDAMLDRALRELAAERARRIELEGRLEALRELERDLEQRMMAERDEQD